MIHSDAGFTRKELQFIIFYRNILKSQAAPVYQRLIAYQNMQVGVEKARNRIKY